VTVMTDKMTANLRPANASLRHEITSADLPLHCPMDGETKWNSHPRVFLPIEDKGEILCPYCGELYVLKSVEK